MARSGDGMTFAELLVFHADLERERQRLYEISDRAPKRMRATLEEAAGSIIEVQLMLRTDIGQAALDEVLPSPSPAPAEQPFDYVGD